MDKKRVFKASEPRYSKGIVATQRPPVSSQNLTAKESKPIERWIQDVESKDRRVISRSVTDEGIFHSKADNKRNKRYSKAERELIDTFARCQQEKSLQELQVASLKKVLSILSNSIADSKARLDQLHVLLADRDTDPELYRSLQCERWMEERRQLSAVEVSKVLEERLAIVMSSLPAPAEASCSSEPSASRANSNLAKFLESPRRRVPTRNRTRRRVYVPPGPQDVLSRLPSTSVMQTESNPTISTALSTPATPQASPSLLQTALINSTQKLSTVDENSGCITIWRDSPRSKEEILADLTVDMPDYVGDLLSGLDSTTYSPASLQIPEEVHSPHLKHSKAREIQSPCSTHSRTSFVPETPRSHRSSVQVHMSPSRKRISTLFSLPEALSSKRTINIDSERAKNSSTPPEPKGVDATTSRPFSVSFSGLPSSDSGASHDPTTDKKTPSRLRHRLSFFRRH
ncbi:hypothetical protein JR316_0006342 [Psilocybe cubensis]|uniref:Uncharacterized protein n=1 Tax=Psilocybe cubensis TaxID=181762 RepID=A0ACB8H264_PSICU|nr:hypothetical protein JR316_0006342 [Psilocybe cubensis]KAH9481815.1 hypothetical protein JR316_0006342 [Psilocybe cubensis]